MKKWQMGVTVVALLVVVYGMNAVSHARMEKAKAMAKAAKLAAQQAEIAAARNQPKTTGPEKKAFNLPKPTGPTTAPVHLEVFLDATNECHEDNVTALDGIPKLYGKLVRVEWLDTNNPKVADRAAKLRIGCDAGLAINGKTSVEVNRMGGKALVDFKGKTNDGYHVRDVYAAINSILKNKGIAVPAAARAAVKKLY